MRYDPATIEPKWQARWQESQAFRTPTDPQELQRKPKFYVLDMFPYPSGAGLHVGHPEGYTATDVLARLKRMQGFNVLHPMGWDAFGLPAERAAVRDGIHPAVITERNITNFRRQIQRLGFSYDWSREINTASVEYYRWTQWIFLKLYEKGLAYMAEVPVNWCPALGTVLANEEVKDGVYVETGDPVERRSMKQWMLRITAYAQRLIDDLDDLDWPESVKDMQRHWIGKSVGAEIKFQIAETDAAFVVFTTRPDTLFGATYCVLSPEHPLVMRIAAPDRRQVVQEYIDSAKNKSDLDRTELDREKTGVFTGAFAQHPITGQKLPLWIADYVLMSYGTGAIMAVPAHDERDHAFARTYELPIVEVVSGAPVSVQEQAFAGDGLLVNSDFLNGKSKAQAIKTMIAWLEKKGCGHAKTQFRLRDWLFSRQRYWGEPFPLAHSAEGEVIPIPEDELPVELPAIDEFMPTPDGKPPLGRASEEWQNVDLHGIPARRELNTMPQWAGSCWYYLRYLDPQNTSAPWSEAAERYWMPVDLYVGGVEHAVLHLLYARFWHKVLFDCGLVHTKEPFQKLFNQGMILAHSYRDDRGKYYLPDQVESRGDRWFVKETEIEVRTQIEKMSKSKYNVVNPDDVISDYGADSMRLYELFMGPLEASKPWQMSGVEGVSRFLHRVWRLVVDDQTGALSSRLTDAAPESTPDLWRCLHKTIRQVLDHTETLKFNTAISQMMVFANDATAAKALPRETIKIFLRLLAPYAPHITEELWHRLGEKALICLQPVPSYDASLVMDDTITLVVQINGKRRASLDVASDLNKTELEALALAHPKIAELVGDRTLRRVVVVPNKLVNIVL